MRFVVRLILIIAFCYLAELYFPWWSIAAVAFLISYLIQGSFFSVFVSAFLGVGLLWIGMAWKIDYDTQSILTTKIAELFYLSETTYLILITGAVGGLVAGIASLAGNSLRKIFNGEKRSSGYYS
ncbi:hypothetical protein ACFLU5_03950 [Bacteroidota bacterium]